ncbi:unnamed protein product, partial [marine sediment metagenome]
FYIAESRVGVDKYIDLPFAYNVNPLGKYNNQDIICSQSKGIISVVPLTTEGRDTYYVLKDRLKSSGFCCNHQECKSTFGISYNCEQNTYECKEVAGYCDSDLGCQPAGGEMFDSNCFRIDNKFYTWESRCVSNTCTTPIQTEVACCPGYCSLTNQVCNFDTGCYDPLTPLPECPAGMCCDGTTAKRQECSTGLECCYETDEHIGICKTECVVEPKCLDDTDCPEDKPICDNNKCIGSDDFRIKCLSKNNGGTRYEFIFS